MSMYELNENLERQIVEAAIRDEVSSLEREARMSNAGRDFAAAELARRARALPTTWLEAPPLRSYAALPRATRPAPPPPPPPPADDDDDLDGRLRRLDLLVTRIAVRGGNPALMAAVIADEHEYYGRYHRR